VIGFSQRRAINGLFYLLFALLLIFLPPLFLIERYQLIPFNKIIALMIASVFAIFILRSRRLDSTDVQLSLFVLIQASLVFMLALAHEVYGYGFDKGYLATALQILFCGIVLVAFIQRRMLKELALMWVFVHLAMGIGGLLVFAIGMTIGVDPMAEFGTRPYYDFGLTYTNVYYQVGDIKIIRIAGLYDEPGTFAFYTSFALILARFLKLGLKIEFLLLIIGFSTLSMAFIVVMALWIGFSVKRVHMGKLLLLVFVIGIGVYSLPNEIRGKLNHVTVDRFLPTEKEGRLLKGDNRLALLKANWQAFLESPILIGHGLHYKEYTSTQYQRGFIGNPAAQLATNGILGSFVMNIHVLILFFLLALNRSYSRKDRALIGLSLLLMLIQRPITINGLGYLFFIICCALIITNHSNEKYIE